LAMPSKTPNKQSLADLLHQEEGADLDFVAARYGDQALDFCRTMRSCAVPDKAMSVDKAFIRRLYDDE